MQKTYFVYILTDKLNSKIYVGVTNNLQRRLFEHKCKVNYSYTARYNINKLVYFESTNNIYAAIHREKRLKHWNRAWKNQLIEKSNPGWEELLV